MELSAGTVTRVNGPIVEVSGGGGLRVAELVTVGSRRLAGEVLSLAGESATVQVYEETSGLRPREAVLASGRPLSAELGPGLLGGVFDGMLRRLQDAGPWLEPGTLAGALDPDRRWRFTPSARPGQDVEPGGLLGTVPETGAITYRALVPHGLSGTVETIAEEGEVTVGETIATVAGHEITLAHTWPVRRPRPAAGRLPSGPPLITGQRAVDLLFPLCQGSTAGVPGGFGTGKTLLLQQIAKWCDADVIVYVGCGERGNELAELLEDFAELEDPRSGQRLMERTVTIVNTSNMPLLAREASIYTGVTVAEHYRDMGYDTVVIADSTSRWAEALRESAARTEELPAEEGYPPELSSTLAAFYERAGRFRTLAGAEASVTILGAVSPPGGDLAEPVTAHTRRFVRAVWSLDRQLAYARHHPAISWTDSSSRDAESIAAFEASEGDDDWAVRRREALQLLLDADRIESVAQLTGVESLPAAERITLISARLLREGVLQQSALSLNDRYCAPSKQAALLALVLDIHRALLSSAEEGTAIERIEALDLSDVARVRDESPADDVAAATRLGAEIESRIGQLR
ncbi:MAG: V-type ATP synthase subunit A [Solirubrobacteraceae bacterium]